MARRYTEHDVFDYLDNCVVYNPGCFFMDLEHPYFYTANSRLSLFADDANWAIVFEKSGYANRAGEIELELTFFGSDLRNLKPGGTTSSPTTPSTSRSWPPTRWTRSPEISRRSRRRRPA